MFNYPSVTSFINSENNFAGMIGTSVLILKLTVLLFTENSAWQICNVQIELT